jgi:hypothetical protein
MTRPLFPQYLPYSPTKAAGGRNFAMVDKQLPLNRNPAPVSVRSTVDLQLSQVA